MGDTDAVRNLTALPLPCLSPRTIWIRGEPTLGRAQGRKRRGSGRFICVLVLRVLCRLPLRYCL
jgi:hypothetical protein